MMHAAPSVCTVFAIAAACRPPTSSNVQRATDSNTPYRIHAACSRPHTRSVQQAADVQRAAGRRRTRRSESAATSNRKRGLTWGRPARVCSSASARAALLPADVGVCVLVCVCTRAHTRVAAHFIERAHVVVEEHPRTPRVHRRIKRRLLAWRPRHSVIKRVGDVYNQRFDECRIILHVPPEGLQRSIVALFLPVVAARSMSVL
jgi:hypothetical protein